MHSRVWTGLLPSAMLLIATGCHTARPTPAGADRSSTEQTIHVPGTYVPSEVDRGAPTPAATPLPGIPARPAPSAQDILAGLPMGRVVFACSSVMRVEVPERVEVRISNDPKESMLAGLQERGVPVDTAARIAPVMKVTLTPDESGVFDVKSLSEDQQLVSGDGFSQWVWAVTPLKSGNHNLYLTVNAVVDVPGLGPQKRQIPVLTQAVRVRADEVYSAGQFWRSNWQWFTTTLLLPLGLWLWKRRSKPQT